MKNFSYDSQIAYQNVQRQRHEQTRDRTLNRRDTRLADIKRIQSIAPSSKSVLCLGCRHPSEITDFHSAGFESRGIDLLENDSEFIDVMDMHDVGKRYPDNRWDVVYMSHSLEHSNDPVNLLKSIFMVSSQGLYVVLPLQNDPNEKDPTVFDFMNRDANAFEDEIEKEIKGLVGKVSVSNVIYRRACGADELSFFVSRMKEENV